MSLKELTEEVYIEILHFYRIVDMTLYRPQIGVAAGI